MERSKLREALSPRPRLIAMLWIVALGTAALMLAYETTKQLVFPRITIWGSHAITIGFTALLATTATYFVGHRFLLLNQELSRHISERTAELEKLMQSQAALQVSEAKYRDLFESANDFIFTTDLETNLLSINRAGRALCGLAPGGPVAKKFTDVLTSQTVLEYEQQITQLVSTQQPRTCEVTIRRGESGAAILELALRPMIENGTVVAVFGIGRDLTERRTMEKRLLQSQKMEAIGTLAGGVAHDFNNLLTVITGYGELAKKRVHDDKQLLSHLEEVLQATERASALTSQLLSFSRYKVSARSVLNLNECVQGMQKMLQRLLREDIELQTALDPALACISADPTQIDQILMNLAANARDAMPSGGTLRFATSNLRVRTFDKRLNLSPADYVALTVSDTGSGMDQETVARIFEPFFTTKEPGKGTGLGLATAYGIVQQSGGQIEVSSQPGHGTSFTLYFPAVARKLSSRREEKVSECPAGSETILLVEDDPALRSLAQRILESAGYTVHSAEGVAAATKILQEINGRIDLVITDVVMADGGGVKLVSNVARTRPQTKVLFISGYTDGKVPKEYLRGDSPSFLAKPFDPTKLALKVRQVLDSSQAITAAQSAWTQ